MEEIIQRLIKLDEKMDIARTKLHERICNMEEMLKSLYCREKSFDKIEVIYPDK